MAAGEFLMSYNSPIFSHSQLWRLIAIELPPHKTTFVEPMIGVLRLLRLWVLAHFTRDFWKAKLEGKVPASMFGKLRGNVYL